MKKLIHKLVALIVMMSLCVSFTPMTFASESDDMFFDFNTYFPEDYFEDIPQWNNISTSQQFTIHSWDGEDAEIWDKSLMYTNGPYNERAGIYLNDTHDSVGVDFSFRFESVSNNVYVDFRQDYTDLYVMVLDKDKNVNFFGKSVATYETGVWYDVSIVFCASTKYATLKFKESSSENWQEFNALYDGTYTNGTTYVFFEMFGGTQNDGGIRYFDNLKIYYPEFRLERAYIKSGLTQNADLNETLLFEYNYTVAPNFEPKIMVKKDGETDNPLFKYEIRDNIIEVSFENLEKNSDYRVTIPDVTGVFGNSGVDGSVEFTTSEYEIETEDIFVSDSQVTASCKSAYSGGVRAYVAASAYDNDDNLLEVKLIPINVAYKEANTVTVTPEFESDYSYIKAMIVKDFASGISFSANVSESDTTKESSDQCENPVALEKIESDGDSFTAKGHNISVDDSIITIQVLKDGKTWKNLDTFDMENGDICEILSGFDAVADIEYGEKFSFTSKLVNGKIPSFRIRFGSGDFAYYNHDFMENINNSQTPEELEELIYENDILQEELSSTLEILTPDEKTEFWKALFDAKNNSINCSEPWNTYSDVTVEAYGASVVARLKCSDELWKLYNTLQEFSKEDIIRQKHMDIYHQLSYTQNHNFLSYIFNNIERYSIAKDFSDDFEKFVIFYAIKGSPAEDIEKIISDSDILDPGKISTFFLLDANQREAVCEKIGQKGLYKTFDSLYDDIEIVSKEQIEADEEIPIGGGNGHGGFEIFIHNPDGSEINENVEQSSRVKLTIMATLVTKPDVIYAVTVYDASGKMKQAKLFNSEKEELFEHDFLEFYTTYDKDATIKILTLDSISSMKPLRQSVPFTFGECKFHMPEAEREQPGVIAYKGRASSVMPSNFILSPEKIRSEGYWYSPPKPVNMDVTYFNRDVAFCALYNPVYNIKTTDSGYVLESIESGDYDIVEFSHDKIANITPDGISILKGNIETSYMFSESCRYYINGDILDYVSPSYFNMDGALYTMAVKDGLIAGISISYSQSAVTKIKNTSKYTMITESDNRIDVASCKFTNGIPDAEDVIEIYYGNQTVIRICDPVFATYYEDGIIADGVPYPLPIYMESYDFINGESCVAYMNSAGDEVVYLKKDYSTKDIVVVLGVEITEDGLFSVRTSKGVIKLDKEYVYVNSSICLPDNLTNISGDPYYYYQTENAHAFEEICEPEEVYGQLRNYLFAKYIITDKTNIIVKTDKYGVFTNNVKLEQQVYYSATVYSRDGVNVDVLLFDDPQGYMVSESAEMLVTDCSDGKISGYSEGKNISISVSDELSTDISAGDYIRFRYINERITEIYNNYNVMYHIKNERYYSQGNPNSPNQAIVATVENIVNGVIYGYSHNGLYVNATDENTKVYLFDISENSLTKTDIRELTFYDWIFMRVIDGKTETVVIYRE